MNKEDDIAVNADLTSFSGGATLLRRMERWAKYFASLVIIISALVLIGWQFDIEFLKRPIPRLAAMNPVSAISFMFSGLSLILLTTKPSSSQKFLYGKILSGFVLLTGLLQFVSIISGLNVSIDTILYAGKLHQDINRIISNRMAPNTAFCFMLSGISLLLLNFETRRRRRMPAQIIAIVISLFALLSIVGYLYRINAFYGALVYIPMAIHTAICFFLLSLSILFANPARGIMKELTSPFGGSIVALFLIPAAIIIPVLLGFIRLWGAWTGIIPFELGTALLILSIVIIFLILAWFIIVSLNKRDRLKHEAENAFRANEGQIKTIFNAAPDAVIVINDTGRVVNWNPKAEALLGWREEEMLGKLLSDTIIPERFRQAHRNGLKHFLRTGEGPLLGRIIETCALTKDNTELDIALNIAPTPKIKGRQLFIGFVRDVTERRRNELQIQRQKQDIQDFIDSMSTLSAKLDAEGKILMVNKIAMQASGLSMEELMRSDFIDGPWWTFDPRVHSRVRDAFKQARSGIAINYDENIFIFGQILTINFSLIPILRPDGSVDYIVAEGRDITVQKKAEEKIKESESMFSTLFYRSPIMKCITEVLTGKFIEVNDAFADFVGYKKEEILGKTSFELNMLVLPERRDQIVKEIQKTGFVRNEETKINDKGGKSRWLSTNIDKMSLGGIECLLTAAIDITTRKDAEEKIRQMNRELEKRVEEKTKEIVQSEKKFRTLIENSTDIISLTDENFKTIYRSPSAERITGLTNEERISVGYIELIHPDDKERMKETLKEILNKPGESISVIYRTRHKEGHYMWLEGMLTNMLHDESIKAIVANLRDVTENKKAQDQLQASESRFRSTIEQFPYPVVTYSPDGTYTNANEAWEIMWQYKRENVKNYNIRKDPQMIASGLSIYVEKAFAGEVATSEPYLYDPALIGHKSPKRWMQMTLYPLKNADGIILEVILILLDVTKNKEAEASLRKSVKEITDYKYALDESSIVAITDQKGIIKHVNDNFCRISKYSSAELIGQDHRIINSGYHPKEFIRDLWVTIANGQIWKGELKNKAKDGTIYWVDTTIVPFLNEEGKPYQYVAIRADITERKQAEEEIKNTLKEISDYKYALDESSIVAITDQKGIIKHVNDNFCKISKYSAGELIGQDHRIINSGHHPKEFIRNLWVTIANGKIWKGELKNKAKDGTIYWVDTTIVPFLNEEGKPYQYVAIRADITERKRGAGKIIELNRSLEEKIIQRTVELKKSNEELEAFTYSVSHDLRAPLRAIIGFTSILEEDYGSKLDEEAKRITSVIRGNTLRMGTLIDDLLAFSRMGKQELIKTRIDTSAMVHEIVDEMMQHNRTGRTVTWNIQPLPAVNADMNTIRQVWINLVSNSIKYSGNKDQPHIEIGSHKKNGQVEFYVKDNGVGFDEQYKSKLFKVFQRLHSPEEFEGTGVGLALVEKIVSKHGGKVRAEAKINEGASFYFSLPD